MILFFLGIVFLLTSASVKYDHNSTEHGDGRVKQAHCSFSREARRIGLEKYLQKVLNTYYELHPQDLVYRPGGVTTEELKAKFRPYDPDPKHLKRISDVARELLKQLNALRVNKGLLKLREKKALAQVKHYLVNNFGTPYNGDYYAGDFLMGPNLFCWQPICDVGYSDIRYGLSNLRIKNLKDVQLVISKMKLVEKTFAQYIHNLKLGIRAGMVRSTEECVAGINSFQRSYFQVFLKGEKGMYCEIPMEVDTTKKKKPVLKNCSYPPLIYMR